MSTAGNIRVFIEHQIKPIIEFKDSTPLKIAYFGFSSLGNSLARFYYNCTDENIYSREQLMPACEHTSVEKSKFNSIRITDSNDIDSNRLRLDFQFFATAPGDFLVRFTEDAQGQSGYQIGEQEAAAVARDAVRDT